MFANHAKNAQLTGSKEHRPDEQAAGRSRTAAMPTAIYTEDTQGPARASAAHATPAHATRRSRRHEALTLALAFLLPVAILVISSVRNGICPFGDISLLVGDLDYQYVDFYAWLRRVLMGQDSLLYSFSPSLGTNTWGLYSYYTASPLCLLTLPFDEAHMSECVWAMTALKLGAMGLTSCWYVRRRFELPRPWALTLALGFSWSSWVMAQLGNLMWLDALALLPLVCLGTWRHLREGRWGLLVASLCASVVTNWYMAYMTVPFSLFLLALELVCARASRQEVCRAAVRHAAALALAIPLGAWTFLPTVAAMASPWSLPKTIALVAATLLMLAGGLFVLRRGLASRTYRRLGTALIVAVPAAILALMAFAATHVTPEDGPTILTCTATDLFVGFTPLASLAKTSPQLYPNFVCLTLLAALPLNDRLSPKVRLGICAVLGLWLASVLLWAGQYVWCGLREPHGWYSRACAFAALLAIWVAGLQLAPTPQDKPRETKGEVQPVPQAKAPEAADPHAAAQPATPDEPASRPRLSYAGLVVLLLTCVELTLVAIVSMSSQYNADDPFIKDYVRESRAQLASLEAYDGGTYRFDRTNSRRPEAANNEGMAFGFNQLSSYSSTYNHAAADLLSALGYSEPGEITTRYAWPNLVADALLGVRYAAVSEAEAPAGYALTDIPQTDRGDRVYQNPYALSLGYASTAAVGSLSLEGSDPFGAQNALLQAITRTSGATLYESVEPTVVSESTNARTYEVEVPAGHIGYVYLMGTGGKGFGITVDERAQVVDGKENRHAIYDLGEDDGSARTHTVTVSSPEGTPLPASLAPIFATVDLQRVGEVFGQLSAHQLTVEQLGHACLTGTYEADEDGYLLLSIPYDTGWHASVNGTTAETQPAAGGGMTLIRMPAGTSRLEMRFRPPALVAGCAVTAVALASCAWPALSSRRTARRAQAS